MTKTNIEKIKMIQTAVALKVSRTPSLRIEDAFKEIQYELDSKSFVNDPHSYLHDLNNAHVNSVSLELARSTSTAITLQVVAFDMLYKLKFIPDEAFKFLIKQSPQRIISLPFEGQLMLEAMSRNDEKLENEYNNPDLESDIRIAISSRPVFGFVAYENTFQKWWQSSDLLSAHYQFELLAHARAIYLWKEYHSNNRALAGRFYQERLTQLGDFRAFISELLQREILVENRAETSSQTLLEQKWYPDPNITRIAAEQIYAENFDNLRDFFQLDPGTQAAIEMDDMPPPVPTRINAKNYWQFFKLLFTNGMIQANSGYINKVFDMAQEWGLNTANRDQLLSKGPQVSLLDALIATDVSEVPTSSLGSSSLSSHSNLSFLLFPAGIMALTAAMYCYYSKCGTTLFKSQSPNTKQKRSLTVETRRRSASSAQSLSYTESDFEKAEEEKQPNKKLRAHR
jgi:hypothetical protein